MTARVGSKGQVVIPQRLREEFGIGSGSEVEFEAREDGILVRPEPGPKLPLKGRFHGSGMAERLIEDRGREPR